MPIKVEIDGPMPASVRDRIDGFIRAWIGPCPDGENWSANVRLSEFGHCEILIVTPTQTRLTWSFETVEELPEKIKRWLDYSKSR